MKFYHVIAVMFVCFFLSASVSYAKKPDGNCGGGNGGANDNGQGNGNGNGNGGGNLGRIALCHNGDTYNVETGLEEAVSFVITVNRRALPAHLNHGDCAGLFEENGPIEVCELQDDGSVLCEVKESCTCLPEEPPVEEPPVEEPPVE